MVLRLTKKGKYVIIGAVFVIFAFTYLELLHPYYFTQDDNFAQFLPVLLNSMDQIIHGSFPSINYHQFAGAPTYETGTYAVFYPPTIISYFIAKVIFRNQFLMLEIFALMHLLAAFTISFIFLEKEVGCSVYSLFGSISFTLSGYALILSNSWYYVLPTLVFIPLVFLLHRTIISNHKALPSVMLGLVRGLYFYAGNAQLFFYTCIFEFLFFWINFYSKKGIKKPNYAESYFSSLALSFFITLPLLFPQYFFAKGSPRLNRSFFSYAFSYSLSVKDFIFGGFVNYPIIGTTKYIGYAQSGFIEAYYWNALLFFAFIAAIVYALRLRKSQYTKEYFTYILLSILALILSLGIFGGVYLIGGLLPIIKNFSIPWKFFIYFIFFAVIVAVSFIHLITEKFPKYAKTISVIFAVLSLVFIIIHLNAASKVSLSYYGDKLPLNTSIYDSLNLGQRRIITLTDHGRYDPQIIKNKSVSQSVSFNELLSQNFATYYGLYHISGYEPFVQELTAKTVPIDRFGLSDANLNLTGLGEFGVSYIVIPNQDNQTAQIAMNGLQIYNDSNITIFKIPSKDLVFYDVPINSTISGNKIFFKTNFSQETTVTVNVLAIRGYKATFNNRPLKLSRDSFGRILLIIPPGAGLIKLSYNVKGFWVYEICALLGILLILIYMLFYRNSLIALFKKVNLPKMPRKVFLIIITVIIIISPFLLISQINGRNISAVLNERVNLQTTIGEVKFNPFSHSLIVNEISLPTHGSPANIGKVSILLNVKDTLKTSLYYKRPVFIFSGFIDNVSLVAHPLRESNCPNPIFLSGFNQSDFFKIQNVSIQQAKFVPLNQLDVNLTINAIDSENQSMTINSELSISKYVAGKISAEGENSSYSSCLLLPLSSPNVLFTKID